MIPRFQRRAETLAVNCDGKPSLKIHSLSQRSHSPSSGKLKARKIPSNRYGESSVEQVNLHSLCLMIPSRQDAVDDS